MFSFDVGIAVALGVLALLSGYLGVRLTIHPPQTDAQKDWYKSGFILVGLASIVLIGIQAQRNYASSEDLKAILKKQGEDIESFKKASERPINITVPAASNPKMSSHPGGAQRLALKAQAVQLASEILNFITDRERSGLSTVRAEMPHFQGSPKEVAEALKKNLDDLDREGKRADEFNQETVDRYNAYYTDRVAILLATMKVAGIDVQRAWYRPNSGATIRQFAQDLIAVAASIN